MRISCFGTESKQQIFLFSFSLSLLGTNWEESCAASRSQQCLSTCRAQGKACRGVPHIIQVTGLGDALGLGGANPHQQEPPVPGAGRGHGAALNVQTGGEQDDFPSHSKIPRHFLILDTGVFRETERDLHKCHAHLWRWLIACRPEHQDRSQNPSWVRCKPCCSSCPASLSLRHQRTPNACHPQQPPCLHMGKSLEQLAGGQRCNGNEQQPDTGCHRALGWRSAGAGRLLGHVCLTARTSLPFFPID